MRLRFIAAGLGLTLVSATLIANLIVWLSSH